MLIYCLAHLQIYEPLRIQLWQELNKKMKIENDEKWTIDAKNDNERLVQFTNLSLNYTKKVFNFLDNNNTENLVELIRHNPEFRKYNRQYRMVYYGDLSIQGEDKKRFLNFNNDVIYKGFDFHNCFNYLCIKLRSNTQYPLKEFDMFTIWDLIYSRIIIKDIQEDIKIENTFFYFNKFRKKAIDVINQTKNIFKKYLELNTNSDVNIYFKYISEHLNMILRKLKILDILDDLKKLKELEILEKLEILNKLENSKELKIFEVLDISNTSNELIKESEMSNKKNLEILNKLKKLKMAEVSKLYVSDILKEPVKESEISEILKKSKKSMDKAIEYSEIIEITEIAKRTIKEPIKESKISKTLEILEIALKRLKKLEILKVLKKLEILKELEKLGITSLILNELKVLEILEIIEILKICNTLESKEMSEKLEIFNNFEKLEIKNYETIKTKIEKSTNL